METSGDLIGVIDIGKTHARFVVGSAAAGVLSTDQQHFPAVRGSGGLGELDISGIEQWLSAVIRAHPEHHRVRTLVPIAHGAAGVLVDESGARLAAPDYEDPQFEGVAEAYRPLRDPFETTFSPFLPLGLNLGRQLFYLKTHHPALLAKAHHLLLYPQYWAWRFSGVAASEVTSLGCHSDLWRPLERRSSRLADSQQWPRLLPPSRMASGILGPITPRWQMLTGLPADCRVLCGLHDSSAAFLAHQSAQRNANFTLISSGTWTVLMSADADSSRLREASDMLLNCDVHGAPVATARFMGGREFAAIAGVEGLLAVPEERDLAWIIERQIQAVPSFSHAGGPFAGIAGRILNEAPMDSVRRTALATLYVALMCDYLLDALGCHGSIIIEGPLARNRAFGPLLAAFRPGQDVLLASASSAAFLAAVTLCGLNAQQPPYEVIYPPASIPGASLESYRNRWRSLAGTHP